MLASSVERPVSTLRRRMLEDMAMRGLRSDTQRDYIQNLFVDSQAIRFDFDNNRQLNCVRCPARRPSNPITVINSFEARTWEPPSVLQRRRLARGMRLPMLTCSWTKCWPNSRLWQWMAPGRCDPGQSRRWPEQRCARPSWRSGVFVSVACSGGQIGLLCDIPFVTLYRLFARGTQLGL